MQILFVMMLYIICNVSTVRCRSSWDTLNIVNAYWSRIRSGRSTSTTFSITHSVVLRRCLKFAFWSNGGSECYAWLRWRPFISRNCRHCTTLASSSNIPYCIVLLTDIWTMFSVLIIIIAIIVFVLHYFWYYMFINATSSFIIPLVLTQGILNIFKNNSRTSVGGLAKRRVVPTNFFGGIVTALQALIITRWFGLMTRPLMPIKLKKFRVFSRKITPYLKPELWFITRAHTTQRMHSRVFNLRT